VYERAQATTPGCPKLRKVQEIVRDLKKKAQASQVPVEEPPIVPWGPMWPTDGEEIACLFKLFRTSLDAGWHLGKRTAKWALSLRKLSIGEEGGVTHLNWAYHYVNREKMVLIVNGTRAQPFTGDLAGQMIFRPWESSENFEDYREAVAEGKIPQ